MVSTLEALERYPVLHRATKLMHSASFNEWVQHKVQHFMIFVALSECSKQHKINEYGPFMQF